MDLVNSSSVIRYPLVISAQASASEKLSKSLRMLASALLNRFGNAVLGELGGQVWRPSRGRIVRLSPHPVDRVHIESFFEVHLHQSAQQPRSAARVEFAVLCFAQAGDEDGDGAQEGS